MAAEQAIKNQTSLPTKRIVSKAHLDAWLSSSTHTDLVNFVEELNESVVGVKLHDEVLESDVSLFHSRSRCLESVLRTEPVTSIILNI